MEFTATLEDMSSPFSSSSSKRATSSKSETRFRFMSADELGQRAQKEWLIQDFLPQRSTAVLVGRYNTYKSFVALDMAWSIASGVNWQGRTVKPGSVAYVMAEGASGLSHRLRAWQHARRAMPDACYYLDQAVQLADVNDADQMLRALDLLQTLPQFVVIDTLARCMVGRDENSVKDMGQFIASIDRIKDYCGATVMVVHHCGKDGTPRGSSALASAMDTEILVERRKGGVVLTCNKQKDAAEFRPIVLEPRPHFHPEFSSLVLHTAGSGEMQENRNDEVESAALNANSVKTLEVLATYGTNGATYSEWLTSCEEKGISKTTFNRCRRTLEGQEYVTQEDGFYQCADLILDNLY